MRFTQAVAYGISALNYLANHPKGELVSNTTICDELQMPTKFVQQVLVLLSSAGIVKSQRGRFGGVQLAKPANRITLLEIIEAIDGPLGRDETLDLTGLAQSSQATVEKTLAAVTADARKQLASITLAGLRAAKAA